MPYPTPYDVPEEAKQLALYQSLLGMGSQLLQPKPYKTGFLGDVGNVFGAASQGVSNIGSLLGNYQAAMQNQELMRLKQAEDARQTQQLNAQIPLWQAHANYYNKQAQPEQSLTINGITAPISAFQHITPFLAANTRQSEELRKINEAKKYDIGMQNLGLLQNLDANTEGMSPADKAIAEASIREQAMRGAPKETQDYMKLIKPEKQPVDMIWVKNSAGSTLRVNANDPDVQQKLMDKSFVKYENEADAYSVVPGFQTADNQPVFFSRRTAQTLPAGEIKKTPSSKAASLEIMKQLLNPQSSPQSSPVVKQNIDPELIAEMKRRGLLK